MSKYGAVEGDCPDCSHAWEWHKSSGCVERVRTEVYDNIQPFCGCRLLPAQETR